MTTVSTHVIGENKFSVEIDENYCLQITVGRTRLQVFFHCDSVDRALHDIDVAIRAYLDNRK